MMCQGDFVIYSLYDIPNRIERNIRALAIVIDGEGVESAGGFDLYDDRLDRIAGIAGRLEAIHYDSRYILFCNLVRRALPSVILIQLRDLIHFPIQHIQDIPIRIRLYIQQGAGREGQVHHRELMCRIFDGNEEVSSAEYMPMVLQFGLSEEYDRLQISRLIPLLRYWPEENLAIQVTVESLIRPRFQRWLRDTLMQCEKSQRKRIIIELAEADVGQHISRLQPVIRLVNALGVRVAVNQAGLTLVSTSWIKELNVELLKLHPGLVRNIEKRTENQLLVQSLVEACSGTSTQVYATGVRSRSEWQTLIQRGVTGGQGDFFASSQPLDTNVKKYSQRYSV